MKYLFYSLLFIVLIFFLNYKTSKYSQFRKTTYRLEGKGYRLLVADSPEKWEKGLMGFKKLGGFDGMIFSFPEKKIRFFWNKNTYLNLKLIWLNDDKIVKKNYLPSIVKGRKPLIVSSEKKVNKVIELVVAGK